MGSPIEWDRTLSCGLPSYYARTLFASDLGDHAVKTLGEGFAPLILLVGNRVQRGQDTRPQAGKGGPATNTITHPDAIKPLFILLTYD
jgi:hypothetical protein